MKPSFDYTAALREVCRDICVKLPIFRRYDLKYVGFAIRTTRNDERYGVFASLTPLRFENGARATFKRGVYWKIPEICDSDERTKLLYILTAYVPRFINLGLKEKIETIVHELYHINPAFNGDIRRFEGRKYAHGSSRKKYDAVVAKIADEWLATDPNPRLWNFLHWNVDELRERVGRVAGWRFPTVPLRKIPSEEGLRLIEEAKISRSGSDFS